MNELAITLLRFSFLGLLWLIVFAIVAVLRRDLYTSNTGLKRVRRAKPGIQPKQTINSSAPMPQGATSPRSAPSRLVVLEGPLAGTSLPLTQAPITLGRASDCNLVLDDGYTSSHHAHLYFDGGSWYLEDLGSTNGTFIDRRRVGTPVPVGVGQRIRVGQTTLELQR